jgi:uncharacterized Zn finger protein
VSGTPPDPAPSPFAHILHRDAMRRLAGDATFLRGQDYFARGRVASVARRGAQLVGRVAGTQRYDVSLWVKDQGLAYSCTCPVGQAGDFCKHGVAVGLAWLGKDAASAEADGATVEAIEAIEAIEAYLGARSKDELAALLLEAARRDERLRERLARRARGGR